MHVFALAKREEHNKLQGRNQLLDEARQTALRGSAKEIRVNQAQVIVDPQERVRIQQQPIAVNENRIIREKVYNII